MKLVMAGYSPIVQERLQFMFSEIENMEVLVYKNQIGDFLNYVSELQPEIIIMNVHINNNNGLDVVENIRNKFPGIVIIILSSYGFAPFREKFMEMGADHYFDLSVNLEIIRELVYKYINGTDYSKKTGSSS